MKNIEKHCLQSLKRQNKLLANTICVKQNSFHFENKMFAEVHKLKKKSLQRKTLHTPLQENNGPSLIVLLFDQ